jgi:hypothetical protein
LSLGSITEESDMDGFSFFGSSGFRTRFFFGQDVWIFLWFFLGFGFGFFHCSDNGFYFSFSWIWFFWFLSFSQDVGFFDGSGFLTDFLDLNFFVD